VRDMHSVDIQYPQILREDDCFPPLFRRTRGQPLPLTTDQLAAHPEKLCHMY